MGFVRLGRPTFLRDTALWLLYGAAGGLVLAAVVALAGFPAWGASLMRFLGGLSAILLYGLVLRLLLHIGIEYKNHRPDATQDMPRADILNHSRWLLRLGAGATGAEAVLSVAFLVGTGELSPGY
ncbi:MAG: hypothetical protein H7323_10485 [Frankiales bacterium]|nr:hypothetical protein [Frankiales bacterium]